MRRRFFARVCPKGAPLILGPSVMIPSKKPLEPITPLQAAPDDDDVIRTCSGGSAESAAAAGDVAPSGDRAATAANGDAAAGSRSSPLRQPPPPKESRGAVVKRGNSGSGGEGGDGGGSRVSLGTKFVVVTAPYSDQIKAGSGCGVDSSDQQRPGNGEAGGDQEEAGRGRRVEADASQLHEGKSDPPRPTEREGERDGRKKAAQRERPNASPIMSVTRRSDGLTLTGGLAHAAATEAVCHSLHCASCCKPRKKPCTEIVSYIHPSTWAMCARVGIVSTPKGRMTMTKATLPSSSSNETEKDRRRRYLCHAGKFI